MVQQLEYITLELGFFLYLTYFGSSVCDICMITYVTIPFTGHFRYEY